ncbi:MAG: AAA family ATPase, partial [Thermoplasmata archaeon]
MPERMTRSPEEIKASVDAVKRELSKTIVGYEDQIEDFLICLATRGHLLIEGVPGVAKTTLSKSFAAACALTYKRIQFTQDLLPADITGHFFY